MYWAAVCPAWCDVEGLGGRVVSLPPGCLVVYREYYGIETDRDGNFMANRGMRKVAELLGQEIAELSQDDPPRMLAVADPSAFTPSGTTLGASVMQQLQESEYDWYTQRGIPWPGGWYKADRRRTGPEGVVAGWNEMRRRMRGVPDPHEPGRFHSMLVPFATCKHLFRTLPRMKHNPARTEDMLKKGMEDHAVDTIRYLCASRPQEEFPTVAPKQVFRGIETVDDLFRDMDRWRKGRGGRRVIALGSIVEWGR